MSKYGRLTQAMKEMSSFFEEFSVVEQKKLDAILVNDVESLENYMREEQAFALRMKGLERNREQALTELGKSGATFSDLKEELLTEGETAMLEIHEALSKQIEDFKANHEIIKIEVERKLHSIKILLERLDNTADQMTYGKNGQADGEAAKTFRSKRV